MSISYGQAERDFSKAYEARQCTEFLKLGLQGHTIFVSSGDYGVGIWANDALPDGCLNTTDPRYSQRVFTPGHPATCPYVTSVGATRQYPGQTVKHAESVVDIQREGQALALEVAFPTITRRPLLNRRPYGRISTSMIQGRAMLR